MSITKGVTVSVNKHFVRKVERLFEYKSIADEILSALNEKNFTDPYMLSLQDLALRALNIGAHKKNKKRRKK